ncbi:MAG: hypothetical protein MUP63_00950 [Candidatus Nanohaloarchaeota archaeon QJJ-7]|nr:hypothetical protein [Candidatus Nanohaloarchaeota archaeon QJJ-7]
MSWEDKTVSLGNVDSEEFESGLAHVIVSEKGISVGFKDVEDWKRIKREVGGDKILKQVEWGEVEDIEKVIEHLYYPYIDVDTGRGEKRLYFVEDEEEIIEECFSIIREFWNSYRQRGAGSRDTYSFRDEDVDSVEDGKEEAKLVEEKEEDTGEDEEEEDTGGDEEEKDAEGEEDQESVKDVVEGFMEG